jgi:molybdenum cofactor cytidylyltransferase
MGTASSSVTGQSNPGFRVFAVIPAAGTSTRMGEPKLLLPFRGRPLVEHLLTAVSNSSVARTVIVVRPGDTALIDFCRQFAVEVVIPESSPPDMKASVQSALFHIESHYEPRPHDAWLLAPADMPRLSAGVVQQVVLAHDPNNPRIILPIHHGKRGHPVLIPWQWASLVQQLPPHEGVNALTRSLPVWELTCDRASVLDDIDNADDYRRLLADSESP